MLQHWLLFGDQFDSEWGNLNLHNKCQYKSASMYVKAALFLGYSNDTTILMKGIRYSQVPFESAVMAKNVITSLRGYDCSILYSCNTFSTV